MMSEVQWTPVQNVVFFSKRSIVIKLPAKMYPVLPLEVIATIRIFKIPIYRFFSKWVFSNTNLITFKVMT